jgi:cobalamin biosynthesis protein CbiD
MEKHNERGREGEGELGESFIRSVWSSSKDVVVEMGDVGLDLVTKSELLESIPVLGVFAKLSKAAYSLRNRLFLKKLQNFLRLL